MQPQGDHQSRHSEVATASPAFQDAAAAAGATGAGAPMQAAAGPVQMTPAEVAKAATKALSAMGSSGRSAGSSFSSGLMIDGFHVPPHVLQALQELRLQAGGSASPPQPDAALQDVAAAAQQSPPEPKQGEVNIDPREVQEPHDEASPDAAGSSPSGSGPFLSPPSSEAAVQEPCGSPHYSSSSGRGRHSLTGYSSRGSSRSSGRHSSRSGGSGRSSGSGRSGHSGRGGAVVHSVGTESESEEHVAGLEVAVAELSARSAANAAVISQLNTDIISLSTTNEALRQRLQLLTGQLRHRDVEIDNLRTDVRRLRSVMTGPIDNKASKASARGSSSHA